VSALDPRADDNLVEIGPGLGALTGPLLERVQRLTVIEIDHDLAARMAAEHPSGRLTLYNADALDFDFGSLGSELRVGQSTVGADFLLPAFAGALLGATSVRPGRVNVWGTLLAVSVLAVAVSGLQQLGADFYVEPLFNGAMLVLAVGLAEYARRRRERSMAVHRNAETFRSGEVLTK